MKHSTGLVALFAAGMLLLFGSSSGSADILGDGGHRLVDLQADMTADNAGNGFDDTDPDDGGWDWYLLPSDSAHSSSASPENLFGVTANGLLSAFQAEGGLRLAIGILDAYYGIVENPDIDSGPDFGFLVALSEISGDPYYANLARDRWDLKMASYGGADSLALLIKESRHPDWDGLIPWDIGLFIESAMALQEYFPGQGYLSDAIDMADVIYNDISSPSPYFDMEDETEPAYTLGLQGIVVSFGLTDVYLDYGVDAALILLNSQNTDGSWGWNADYPDGDEQSTAYVVMGFGILDVPYRIVNNAAQRGSDWLASRQEPNGGWDLGGYEYPEVNGECLRAIGYYQPAANAFGTGSAGSERVSHHLPHHPWTD